MNNTEKRITRFFDNITSILIYAIVFLILIGLVDQHLTTRQYIGLSLILGFFMGAINNIERVLRELFDKKHK